LIEPLEAELIYSNPFLQKLCANMICSGLISGSTNLFSDDRYKRYCRKNIAFMIAGKHSEAPCEK
jgi:hypothetical protein